MITRDAVQGFIDGYKATGGNMATLNDALARWLISHPLYPSNAEDAKKIVGDLESYRR